MTNEISQKIFARAREHLPGGVNSPVRAFKAVGGTAPVIVRAKGAQVFDADGNVYIDFVGSWGPAILGHAHPEIVSTLAQVAKNGLSFGALCPLEVELAEAVKKALPAVELIRFVNSGTEATMSAIRLARGFTGRNGVIKFDGAYHGHADYLLVRAGSGAETCGVPDSKGVPASFVEHTFVARFNDLGSVNSIIAAHPGEIACLIVEPVMGNMGCIQPKEGFLQGLRELCTKYGIVLIFDEVMTGFRVAFGGAQTLYSVRPDLTCLGKIIGGGLPVGAYGGRRDIMECVAPVGPVYQAGTLSGNPLAMAVGLKTLSILSQKNIYGALEALAGQLSDGLKDAAKTNGVPLVVNRVGSMLSFFFSDCAVMNADDARLCESKKFVKLFHHLLAEGIYLPPSPFEAFFVSMAHTTDHIERTVSAFQKGLSLLD